MSGVGLNVLPKRKWARLVSLVVMVLGGLYLVVISPLGMGCIRRVVQSKINGRIHGRLSIGSLRSNVFSRLVMEDVSLTTAGPEPGRALRIGRVELAYDLRSLVRKGATKRLCLRRPACWLLVGQEGTTNFSTLLADPKPHAQQQEPPFLLPDSLLVQDGALFVNHVQGGWQSTLADITIHYRRAEGAAWGTGGLKVGGVSWVSRAFSDSTISFSAGFGVDADSLSITALSLASAWGGLQGSGSISLPDASDFEFSGAVQADLSQLHRHVPAAPKISGQAALEAEVASASPHTRIDAQATVTDVELPWAQIPLLRAAASVADSILTLAGCTVETNTGSVRVEGEWHFSARRPEHWLRLVAKSLELEPVLQALLPQQRVGGLLDADLQLRGEQPGEAPSAARTRLYLARCEVGAFPIGDIFVDAAYENGSVSLSGNIGNVPYSASGTLRPDGDVELELGATAFETPSFLPWVTVNGSGNVVMAARVHGRLPRPQLAVELRGRAFRVGALQCDSLVAAVESDSIGVATLNVSLNGDDIGLRGQLDLPRREVRWARLGVDSLDLGKGLVLPGGTQIGGVLTANAQIEGPLDVLRVEGDLGLRDGAWREQVWGDLDGRFLLSDNVLYGEVLGMDSTLSGQCEVSLGVGHRLEGWLALKRFSLGPLFRAWGVRDGSGVISARVEASGPAANPAKLKGVATLDTLAMAIRGRSFWTPQQTRLVLEEGRLTVDGWDVVAASGRLSMGGTVAVRGPQQFHLKLSQLPVGLLGLTTASGDSLKGMLDGQVAVSGLAQRPGLEGRLQWRAPGVLGLDSLSVHFGTHNEKMQVSVCARQDGPGTLWADADLPLPRLAGGLSSARANIPVRLAVRSHRFRIPGRAVLPQASPALWVVTQGRASLTGKLGEWEGWRGALALDSLRVFTPEAGWLNAQPVLVELEAGDLKIGSLVMRGYPEPGEHSTETSGQGPTTGEWQVSAEGVISLSEASSLTMSANDLDLGIVAALVGMGERLSGQLDMDLVWSGTRHAPDVKAKWEVADGRFQRLPFSRMSGGLMYADRRLVLEDVALDLGRQTIYVEANIPVGVRLLDPQAAAAGDTFYVAARAPWLDVSQLPLEVPQVARMGGQLYVNSRIHGTLGAPVGEGTIEATSLEAKLRGLDDALSFERIVVRLDSSAAVLSTEGGRLGPGDLSLSGWVSFEPETQGAFSLGVKAQKVPLRSRRTVDLTANLDLECSGQPSRSRCSGRIEIIEGVFREALGPSTLLRSRDRVSRPRKEQSPVLKGLELDVGVATKNPFLVRNNLAELSLEASLHIGGTAARPSVVGTLESTRGGYVHYLDRRFAVDHLRLHTEGPYGLEPELSVRATTQVLDLVNVTPYTIDLEASGRLPRPAVVLRSEPSLGQLDIVSLLTLGTTESPFLVGEESPVALVSDRARDLAIQRALGLTSQQFSRTLASYGINVNTHASDASEWAGARIRLDKQLTQRMVVVYTTSVGGSARQEVEVDYKLTDYLSLETQTDQDGDAGLDLRFKYRF